MAGHLNGRERYDFQRLRETLDRVSAKYSAPDASYHSPHGVAEFAHMFYHHAFEHEMREQAKALAAQIDAGEEVEGVQRTSDGGAMLAPNHIENVVRQAFEMVLLVGIEHGRRGFKPTECKCIQELGDEVESQLHSGEWGHP